jgi:hypothetical protein
MLSNTQLTQEEMQSRLDKIKESLPSLHDAIKNCTHANADAIKSRLLHQNLQTLKLFVVI